MMSDGSTGSNSLPELAARIKAEHQACEEAHAQALNHAVAAGNMLIEAKAKLKHGEWLPWLRDHCAISERKAQRYMKIAPHVCKSDSVSDLVPLTDEWAHHRLTGPFDEQDFATGQVVGMNWLLLKLMNHAGVPAIPAFLATVKDVDRTPLLRLCPFDQLEAALKALAPFASEKAPFKIDLGNMADVLEASVTLHSLSMWLTGKFVIEAKHRFDLPDHYSDEDYEKEWTRTHTAWMARMDAELREIEAAKVVRS